MSTRKSIITACGLIVIVVGALALIAGCAGMAKVGAQIGKDQGYLSKARPERVSYIDVSMVGIG